MYRILLVLETSGGGSARHVVDLSQQLLKLGHEVHIIYSGRRMEDWFYEEISTMNGLIHYRVDMHRSPHYSDWVAMRRIRAITKEQGPFDVIHGHSSKAGALIRLAALGQPGVRVYTPHAFRSLDPSLSAWTRYLYTGIERVLSPFAHGIILVSEEEYDHAVSVGFSQSNLYVVHNGLCQRLDIPSADKVRKRLGIADDEFVTGFVGRLVAQKAPRLALDAFAILYRQFPNSRLVIAGDGEQSEQLHAQASTLDITQKIIWLEGEEGCQIMPAFDVFLMPSRYEAFPYVLIEAAYNGLPIISTPVGGTRSVVLHEKNGFIVSHDSPGDIANVLLNLACNESLRNTMSAESKKLSQRFTVEVMTQNTLALYERLIAGQVN